MSGFALMSNFACEACGSPGFTLPQELSETAVICCSGCGNALGTWGEFKERTRNMILSDIESGDCDPRVAGADLALKV